MDSIGLFQFENLIVSRHIFPLIDLREGEPSPLPEPLQGYLKSAQRIAPDVLTQELLRLMPDKTRPLLLISQTESIAEKCANELEAVGYSNVYIIAGGVEGLLKEL